MHAHAHDHTQPYLTGHCHACAGSTLVHPWAAFVTGAFGGILYVQTSDLMLRFQLDDVVNAVAIHLSPGIWGCLAVGLFATEAHLKRAYPVSSFEPCAAPPLRHPARALVPPVHSCVGPICAYVHAYATE